MSDPATSLIMLIVVVVASFYIWNNVLEDSTKKNIKDSFNGLFGSKSPSTSASSGDGEDEGGAPSGWGPSSGEDEGGAPSGWGPSSGEDEGGAPNGWGPSSGGGTGTPNSPITVTVTSPPAAAPLNVPSGNSDVSAIIAALPGILNASQQTPVDLTPIINRLDQLGRGSDNAELTTSINTLITELARSRNTLTTGVSNAANQVQSNLGSTPPPQLPGQSQTPAPAQAATDTQPRLFSSAANIIYTGTTPSNVAFSWFLSPLPDNLALLINGSADNRDTRSSTAAWTVSTTSYKYDIPSTLVGTNLTFQLVSIKGNETTIPMSGTLALTVGGAPPSIQGLIQSGLADKTVTIGWSSIAWTDATAPKQIEIKVTKGTVTSSGVFTPDGTTPYTYYASTTTDTSYPITGLIPLTTYQISVTAVQGSSRQTSSTTVTTLADSSKKLGVVGSPTVADDGSQITIILKPENISTISKFSMQISDVDQNGNIVPMPEIPIEAARNAFNASTNENRTVNITLLNQPFARGHIYPSNIYVQELASGDKIYANAVINITIRNASDLAVTLSNSQPTDTSVALTWSATLATSLSTRKYRTRVIYREYQAGRLENAKYGWEFAEVPNNGRQYTLTGLTPGTQYEIGVKLVFGTAANDIYGANPIIVRTTGGSVIGLSNPVFNGTTARINWTATGTPTFQIKFNYANSVYKTLSATSTPESVVISNQSAIISGIDIASTYQLKVTIGSLSQEIQLSPSRSTSLIKLFSIPDTNNQNSYIEDDNFMINAGKFGFGASIDRPSVADRDACQEECMLNNECSMWTYKRPVCTLYSTQETGSGYNDTIRGLKRDATGGDFAQIVAFTPGDQTTNFNKTTTSNNTVEECYTFCQSSADCTAWEFKSNLSSTNKCVIWKPKVSGTGTSIGLKGNYSHVSGIGTFANIRYEDSKLKWNTLTNATSVNGFLIQYKQTTDQYFNRMNTLKAKSLTEADVSSMTPGTYHFRIIYAGGAAISEITPITIPQPSRIGTRQPLAPVIDFLPPGNVITNVVISKINDTTGRIMWSYAGGWAEYLHEEAYRTEFSKFKVYVTKVGSSTAVSSSDDNAQLLIKTPINNGVFPYEADIKNFESYTPGASYIANVVYNENFTAISNVSATPLTMDATMGKISINITPKKNTVSVQVTYTGYKIRVTPNGFTPSLTSTDASKFTLRMKMTDADPWGTVSGTPTYQTDGTFLWDINASLDNNTTYQFQVTYTGVTPATATLNTARDYGELTITSITPNPLGSGNPTLRFASTARLQSNVQLLQWPGYASDKPSTVTPIDIDDVEIISGSVILTSIPSQIATYAIQSKDSTGVISPPYTYIDDRKKITLNLKEVAKGLKDTHPLYLANITVEVTTSGLPAQTSYFLKYRNMNTATTGFIQRSDIKTTKLLSNTVIRSSYSDEQSITDLRNIKIEGQTLVYTDVIVYAKNVDMVIFAESNIYTFDETITNYTNPGDTTPTLTQQIQTSLGTSPVTLPSARTGFYIGEKGLTVDQNNTIKLLTSGSSSMPVKITSGTGTNNNTTLPDNFIYYKYVTDGVSRDIKLTGRVYGYLKIYKFDPPSTWTPIQINGSDSTWTGTPRTTGTFVITGVRITKKETLFAFKVNNDSTDKSGVLKLDIIDEAKTPTTHTINKSNLTSRIPKITIRNTSNECLAFKSLGMKDAVEVKTCSGSDATQEWYYDVNRSHIKTIDNNCLAIDRGDKSTNEQGGYLFSHSGSNNDWAYLATETCDDVNIRQKFAYDNSIGRITSQADPLASISFDDYDYPADKGGSRRDANGFQTGKVNNFRGVLRQNNEAAYGIAPIYVYTDAIVNEP